MKHKNSLRLNPIGILLVLALAAALPFSYPFVASAQASDHEILADPIKTDAGYVSGTVIGSVEKPVRIYRGIPYAAPPVGDLRWRPPQPVEPWKGIRECTKYGKWAPQKFPAPARYGGTPESGMSEDCLYLNVLTPAKKTTDRLPVLVWFHGGHLRAQSGNRPSYNVPYLSQHGAVVVTVTHRLGALGYMAHPLLTKESRMRASGNYGQLDLVAALKWVQKNIAAFGGDPGRVTIWGQSGGGMKVTALMASPLARGLFQRAIVMSGIAGGTSLEKAEQWGVKIAEKLGIPDTQDALKALRAKSWQEIVTASLDKDLRYMPHVTVDGWYLLDTVPNTFAAGKQLDVPLMIGMMEQDHPKVAPTYALIPKIKTGKFPMYVYLWTHVPSGWRMDGAKAYHSLDKGYVFGSPWTQTLGNYERYAKPAGATKKDPGWDEHDEWLTEFALETWIQFAATGNPNLPSHPQLGSLVEWPAYKPDTDLYLDIKVPTEVKSGFSKLEVFKSK